MATKPRQFYSAERAAERLAKETGKPIAAPAVLEALRTGALKGRNWGGRVGWVTTESALVEFIESGNAAALTTT